MSNVFDQYPLDEWKDPSYRFMDKFSLAGKKGFVTGGAGGLGRNAAAAWAEAGADVLVAGSAVYGAEDPAQAIDDIRDKAAAAFRA